MQVSTSLQGQVIPYVTGRTRVTFNLIWYGDFQAHGQGSSSKGGGGAPSSYNYTAAFIAALALGPIQGYYTVYHDRSITSLTYENLAYALGSNGQPTWTGYPSGTPEAQQIPYSNIAYVASPNYNFGGSASMPNLNFEIEGSVPGYSDAHTIYDADMSAVIVDYLTNPVTGAGFAGTIDTLTGQTDTFQAYCMSLGLLVSNYENNQRAATDFMKEHMQIANSDFVLSCGTLRVVPYADVPVSGTTADGKRWSYTPNLTPVYIFDDGDFSPKEGDDPVKLKRKALSDTYNICNIEYLDRSDYYNPSPASASDNGDISIRGPRCMPTLTLHQITNATMAKQVAQLILNFQLYERNTYEFRVRADYWLLEPMDYIGINDSGLGLVNQVCRIIQIDEDEDNFLTFTAMEVPGTIRNTPLYNWNGAQGYFLNFDALPQDVQPPAIFAMPPVAAAISDGITVGIAVSGVTGDSFWGGCNIYCSVDGGDTYGFIGTVGGPTGPGRYGQITTALSAEPDPDTVSMLGVALANTNLQLSTTVTESDADDLQTLILVGSGSTAEVMSYGQGVLGSPGNYTLSYLRRGLYGSEPIAQIAGALFVRLDNAIFQIAFDPGMAGQELFFKFCSFNAVGRAPQEIADVEAYPYTIPAALAVSGGNTWTVQGSNVGITAKGDTVYKSGGSAAWDSAAYGPQPFLDGAYIAFTAAGSLSTLQMIGFSVSPASLGPEYEALRLGIYLNAGTVEVYQTVSGTTSYVGSYGSYAIGNTFEMRYDGVTLRCFHNGALFYAQRASGLSVYPMICLYSPTAIVASLSYGPATSVNQPTGSLINTYPWVIGTSGTQGNFVDQTQAGHPSQIVQAGGTGVPLGPYGTSEALWQTQGIANAGQDGGWANNGDLYGYDSTKTYRSIAWVYWNGVGTTAAIYFGCDTAYTNFVNGTSNPNPFFVQLEFNGNLAPGKWYLVVGLLHGAGYTGSQSGITGIYDPATGAQVFAGADFVSKPNAPYQTQRAFNSGDSNTGSIVWIAKPRFEEVNGNEPTLQALMAPASALQGFVSTGTAQIAGTSVFKDGGSTGWNSCVYSVNCYQVCHIAAKPIPGHYEMLGFSDSPSLSSSYTNGNYCWYNQSGVWAIYESGVAHGTYGAAAASDLVEVLCNGANITYLLNKVVKRTVALASVVPLYAFMPLYDLGSGWNLVDFGPSDVTGVIDTSGVGQNAITSTGGTYSSSLTISSTGSTVLLVLPTQQQACSMQVVASVSNTVSPLGTNAIYELIANAGGGNISIDSTLVSLSGATAAFTFNSTIDCAAGATPTISIDMLTLTSGTSLQFNDLNVNVTFLKR